MSTVHLTMTGVFAGVSICGVKAEGDTGVHYAYAPIDNAEFRATVCPQCLMAHVESFTADEMKDAPDWVKEMAAGDSAKQQNLFEDGSKEC